MSSNSDDDDDRDDEGDRDNDDDRDDDDEVCRILTTIINITYSLSSESASPSLPLSPNPLFQIMCCKLFRGRV